MTETTSPSLPPTAPPTTPAPPTTGSGRGAGGTPNIASATFTNASARSSLSSQPGQHISVLGAPTLSLSQQHSPPPRQQQTQQQQQQPQEVPVDPRVANLKAIFPDFDDIILQSVLESVNWSEDRAIDALLGMSDPTYKTEARHQEAPIDTRTQTELDEELARRLALEDQEQQSAWTAQQYAPRPPRPTNRQTRTPGQVAQEQQPQGDTSLAEVQEHLGKFAEVGKRTLGNLFSKVKAKIQEFENPRPYAPESAQQQPGWGGGEASYGTYQPQQQQQQQHRSPFANQYQSSALQPSGQSTSPLNQQQFSPTQIQGPQSLASQPAFYDPNNYALSPSPMSLSPNPDTVSRRTEREREREQERDIDLIGYDMSEPPEPMLPDSLRRNTRTPPATAATVIMAGAAAGTTSPPPSKIDAGKLGLLPKRPVSLLRPQSPEAPAPAAAGLGSGGALTPSLSLSSSAPAPAAVVPPDASRTIVVRHDDSDSDEDLEYAENPFEDGRRK